ncbi:MAG: hypothetical protein OXH75_25495 [Acidobacteria bacterium]|nr:hypothetical protein [Acidobacteriota bacterium]
MKRPAPHRIGPVRGDLPAPCAAAALSSLTGRTVAYCHRVLARNHGRCPLDSAVTPGVLTSLDDLGFRHVLERHQPAPTFAAWAASAVTGVHLVVVPNHILAAEVVAAPGGAVVLRVADNGEFCTPQPAPPAAALLSLPVHESIHCRPRVHDKFV